VEFLLFSWNPVIWNERALQASNFYAWFTEQAAVRLLSLRHN